MKIKEIIVVEGKNDTVKLKQVVNADTIETNGSAIDEKTIELIKKAQEKRGVIVFTDPDFPGQKIRNIINENVFGCKNAFLEKKKALGKNKVGIEHAKAEDILEALENCVCFEKDQNSLSYEEFINLGLLGNKKYREFIANYFKIGHCNGKTCFKRLNMIGITAEQIKKAVGEAYGK